MKAARVSRFLPSAAVICLVLPTSGKAQTTGLDFGYGLWWTDSVSVVYSVALHKTLLGPIDYGIGATHLRGPTGADRNIVTGGELSLGLWRDGSGLYLVAAAGLGMRHSSGSFDTQWSTGVGYGLRPISFLSLGIEARYRVEDQASRGFWRLDPTDSRGMIVQGRVTLGSGKRRDSWPASSRHGTENYAARGDPSTISPIPDASTPAEVAALRTAVVQTALDVMGTPYRWGGEGGSGFDCSGLIRFAYGEHGLILPRSSRDQARMGLQVDPSVPSLRPGDVLGFSDGGGGVNHVGLYVGDGMFIHSSSSGVRLSNLASPVSDGRWWQRRWVSARRLIN